MARKPIGCNLQLLFFVQFNILELFSSTFKPFCVQQPVSNRHRFPAMDISPAFCLITNLLYFPFYFYCKKKSQKLAQIDIQPYLCSAFGKAASVPYPMERWVSG